MARNPSRRQERVGDLLRDLISEILQREMDDPRLGFVSITRVEVSSDLRDARVYVSVLGTEAQQKESWQILRRATGFIRTLLSKQLDLRVVPRLDFRLDPSLEKGTRVLHLLQEVLPPKTSSGESEEREQGKEGEDQNQG